MTMALWRIASDTPTYTSEDLSGEGAKQAGGRWNRKGEAVLYTASNIALACLETIVHLGGNDLPLNRYLVRIDVPDEVWVRRFVPKPKIGWDALPAGKVSLDLGRAWLNDKAGGALLCVPSVVVPEELNVLINPMHPDTAHLSATKVRKWTYDRRTWA